MGAWARVRAGVGGAAASKVSAGARAAPLVGALAQSMSRDKARRAELGSLLSGAGDAAVAAPRAGAVPGAAIAAGGLPRAAPGAGAGARATTRAPPGASLAAQASRPSTRTPTLVAVSSRRACVG